MAEDASPRIGLRAASGSDVESISWIEAALTYLTSQLSNARNAAAHVVHSGTRGAENEQAVLNLVRSVIPSRYMITSGEVTNTQGARSDQQDLIIVDGATSMPFWMDGHLSVVPIEAVVATIEVKTTIDTVKAREAVANLSTVKALLETTPLSQASSPSSPFCGVVALSNRASKHGLVEAYGQECASRPIHQRSDALYVLDELVVMPGDYTDSGEAFFRYWDEDDQDSGRQLICWGKERTALLFFQGLLEHLRNYHAPPLDLLDYLGGHGVKWDFERFVV